MSRKALDLLKEYDEKIDKYVELLKEDFDGYIEEVNKFQFDFMKKWLDEYEKTIDSDAKQILYNLVLYALHESQYGDATEYTESKETLDEIEEIYEKEIGWFLLGAIETYKDGNEYAIVATFGGNYVPQWFELNDEWMEEE